MIASPHVRAHDHIHVWWGVGLPQGNIGRILEVFILPPPPLPLSLCTPWRINSRRANREDGRVCTFVLPKLEVTRTKRSVKILPSTRGRLFHRFSTFRNHCHETWTRINLPTCRLVYYRQNPKRHTALSRLPLSRTYIHVASFRVSADVVDRFDSQAPVSKEKRTRDWEGAKQHAGLQRRQITGFDRSNTPET